MILLTIVMMTHHLMRPSLPLALVMMRIALMMMKTMTICTPVLVLVESVADAVCICNK